MIHPLRFRTSVLPLFVTALTTACVSPPDKGADASASSVITGQVNNEAGAQLSGATVCLGATSTCLTTDAHGAFTLSASNASVPLVASKAGYTTQDRIVTLSEPTLTPIILRAIAQTSTVTLPTAGQPPVVVSVTVNDSSVSLSIPANTLMDPNGQAVTGDVNVTMTFWHPIQSMATSPANLLAENPNGTGEPIPLISFGMAQIEVTQQNQKLQVINGQHLGFSIVEPSTVTTALAAGALHDNWPNLYSLDENTGLWHLEGAYNSPLLTYSGGTFNASLPHLSSWNIDVPPPNTPITPSCVQGVVYSACDAQTPLANTDVKVWFMGYEQLQDLPTHSDSNGHYCIDVDLSFIGSQQAQDVQYFVSGDSYTDTSMFNSGTSVPYPASCFNCGGDNTVFTNGQSTYSWCSSCACSDCEDADTRALGFKNENALYYPTTGSAHVTLQGGTSCAQNNCVQLQGVTLKDPKCPNVTPVTPGTNPCAKAGALRLGDACQPGDVCCPAPGSTQALTCADYLCVSVSN